MLLAIAAAEFLLGLRFIFAYQKSPSTIFYGLFCIAVSIYVGANGLGFAKDNFYISERFGWAGGAMATSLFLPFSYSFPIPRRTIRDLLPLIIWPLVIFPIGFIATELFVRDQAIISFRQGYQTATGPCLPASSSSHPPFRKHVSMLLHYNKLASQDSKLPSRKRGSDVVIHKEIFDSVYRPSSKSMTIFNFTKRVDITLPSFYG